MLSEIPDMRRPQSSVKTKENELSQVIGYSRINFFMAAKYLIISRYSVFFFFTKNKWSFA